MLLSKPPTRRPLLLTNSSSLSHTPPLRTTCGAHIPPLHTTC